MSTPEGRLETTFYAEAKRHHGIAEKIAPTRKGIPDRLLLMPGGRVYLIELKAGTAPTELQKEWILRATRLGANALVLDGEDEVKEFFRQFEAWPE